MARPEGWMPGFDVIVPPPNTADATDKCAGEGYKTTVWCCSTESMFARRPTGTVASQRPRGPG